MAFHYGLREFSEEERARMRDIATSYANGEARLCEEFNITPQRLADVLLDDNIEKCVECAWFCESGDFIDDDGKASRKCGQCREAKTQQMKGE